MAEVDVLTETDLDRIFPNARIPELKIQLSALIPEI